MRGRGMQGVGIKEPAEKEKDGIQSEKETKKTNLEKIKFGYHQL